MKIASERFRADNSDNAPHILFCGGFHSSMHGTKATALQQLCIDQQWHFTRFDYRGHGQSDGDPSQHTLIHWLDDTLAILDEQPINTIIVGSSMGAWLATLAALKRPELVCGLLLLAAAPDFLQRRIAPTLSPSDIWDLQQGNVVKLPTDYDPSRDAGRDAGHDVGREMGRDNGHSSDDNTGHENSYPITQALLDSGNALSILTGNALATLNCPIRLIHGTADKDAPLELAMQLMTQCPESHDAQMTLLHNADHRLSDASALSCITKTLGDFTAQVFN